MAPGSFDKKSSFHALQEDAWAWLLSFPDKPGFEDLPMEFRNLIPKDGGGSFHHALFLLSVCLCLCVSVSVCCVCVCVCVFWCGFSSLAVAVPHALSCSGATI